jgi:hypothetical protein
MLQIVRETYNFDIVRWKVLKKLWGNLLGKTDAYHGLMIPTGIAPSKPDGQSSVRFGGTLEAASTIEERRKRGSLPADGAVPLRKEIPNLKGSV